MPVLAAAFCPHPPLLAPELAGAAAPELDGLRAACDEVVAAIAEYGVPVLVIGPAAGAQAFGPEAAGSLLPWGVDVVAGGRGAPTLPLSLTLGAWLLDRAGVDLARRSYASVTAGSGDPAVPGGDGLVLLVMGDGAATRTAKAPGGLHEGAEAYDSTVLAALESGSSDLLSTAAEAATSDAVGAAGAAAWRTAARLVAGQAAASGRLLTAQAPYGVGYPVALWTW